PAPLAQAVLVAIDQSHGANNRAVGSSAIEAPLLAGVDNQQAAVRSGSGPALDRLLARDDLVGPRLSDRDGTHCPFRHRRSKSFPRPSPNDPPMTRRAGRLEAQQHGVGAEIIGDGLGVQGGELLPIFADELSERQTGLEQPGSGGQSVLAASLP